MKDAHRKDPIWHRARCHCGAIQLRVRADLSAPVSECNCSICRMKGFLHIIVGAEDLVLEQGEDALGTYRFNTGVAQHHFCQRCGITAFYVPRSHPEGFSVNARCLVDVPLADLNIAPFDGQNWEANVAALRADTPVSPGS